MDMPQFRKLLFWILFIFFGWLLSLAYRGFLAWLRFLACSVQNFLKYYEYVNILYMFSFCPTDTNPLNCPIQDQIDNLISNMSASCSTRVCKHWPPPVPNKNKGSVFAIWLRIPKNIHRSNTDTTSNTYSLQTPYKFILIPTNTLANIRTQTKVKNTKTIWSYFTTGTAMNLKHDLILNAPLLTKQKI